jgi:hypothetical protein
MLGIGNAFIDFLGVRHPMAEFIDRGTVVSQQIGENGAGMFDEER